MRAPDAWPEPSPVSSGHSCAGMAFGIGLRHGWGDAQLRFQGVHAVQQAGQRLAHGIGHEVMIQIDALRRDAPPAEREHFPAGNTDHCHGRGDVLDHDRIGPDAGAGADADRTQDLGTGPDHDAVAEVGWRLPGFQEVPPRVTP